MKIQFMPMHLVALIPLFLCSVPSFAIESCPRFSGVLMGEVNSQMFGKAAEEVKIEQNGCKLLSISVRSKGESDFESPAVFSMTDLPAVQNGDSSQPVDVNVGYYIGNEAILISTSTQANPLYASQSMVLIRKNLLGVTAQAVDRSTDSSYDNLTGTFKSK